MWFSVHFRQNNKAFILKVSIIVCFYLIEALLSADMTYFCHAQIWLTELSFYSATLFLMATFFGEVLSVYSRAVEEDEDDLSDNEEDEQIRRELEEKRYRKDPAS